MDYDDSGSEDDNLKQTYNATGVKRRERAQAKWEAAASRNYDLPAGAGNDLEDVLGGIEEANKRKRYVFLRT